MSAVEVSVGGQLLEFSDYDNVWHTIAVDRPKIEMRAGFFQPEMAAGSGDTFLIVYANWRTNGQYEWRIVFASPANQVVYAMRVT